MQEFIAVIFGFPTIVYSILLAMVLVYWVAAVIGLVDFGESDIDLDLAEPSDLSTIASYVVAFGLTGVPFSIVVTLLVLTGWTMCTLASIWLMPWVPTLILKLAAGLGLLALCFALSIIVTARLVRPLRGLFVTQYGRSNNELVGQVCVITTGSVDERQGLAEVAQRGAGILIQVWATSPNTLTRGSRAVIAEYDAAQRRYLVHALEGDR